MVLPSKGLRIRDGQSPDSLYLFLIIEFNIGTKVSPLSGAYSPSFRCSELVEGGRVVTLALGELVHVVLAASDVVLVGLQAADEPLAVVSARVVCGLLLLCVLLLGLSVLLLHRSGLLHRGLLLGRLAAAMAGARAHHGADTLVSDLGTSTKGHAGSDGAHEATAHTTHHAAGLGLGGRGLLAGWGTGRGCLGTGWRAGAAAKEATATASAG